jgi:hypothetical protein
LRPIRNTVLKRSGKELHAPHHHYIGQFRLQPHSVKLTFPLQLIVLIQIKEHTQERRGVLSPRGEGEGEKKERSVLGAQLVRRFVNQ